MVLTPQLRRPSPQVSSNARCNWHTAAGEAEAGFGDPQRSMQPLAATRVALRSKLQAADKPLVLTQRERRLLRSCLSTRSITLTLGICKTDCVSERSMLTPSRLMKVEGGCSLDGFELCPKRRSVSRIASK